MDATTRNVTTPTMPSLGNSSDGDQMSPIFAHVFTAMCLFIGIVGAFANFSILAVFFNVPKVRTKVNYFLASLAVSDLTFLCGILPIELEWHIKRRFDHSVTVCDFIYTLHFLTISCSCLNLMAVSGYRYLTICHPFVSKRIDKKQVLIVLFGIWIYATFTAMLPVMGWRARPSSVDMGTCSYQFYPEFCLFIIGVNWFLPALVVFVIYGLIFRIARIQAKKIAKSQIVLDKADKKRRRYLLKAAISLAKIFTVYMFCWLPYIVISFISLLPNIPYHKVSLPVEYHYLFVILSYSNSTINPFLYAGLCEDFNTAFNKYFHRLANALQTGFASFRNKFRASLRRTITSNQNNQTVEATVRIVTTESRLSVYQPVITIVSSAT